MLRENECVKKTFKDLRSAHKAISKIRGHGDKRQYTPVRAYRCEVCGNYHLTHHERMHWLINTDFRIQGSAATPEIINDRIAELSKIVEQQKKEQENERRERNLETSKGRKRNLRGKQSR